MRSSAFSPLEFRHKMKLSNLIKLARLDLIIYTNAYCVFFYSIMKWHYS